MDEVEGGVRPPFSPLKRILARTSEWAEAEGLSETRSKLILRRLNASQILMGELCILFGTFES